jgi:ketosteroid isomerase-like protein
MSQENVEIVRALFAALQSNEWEELLGLFDAAVEWSPTESHTRRGVEGVVTSFIEWMEPWDEHKIEPEEFIESGDNKVLATVHLTARGEHSGLELDQRFYQLYTMQKGKIKRMIEYHDRVLALEAAGLSG